MKRWNDNQASQRIDSPVVVLATFGLNTSNTASVQFRVPLVDARFRTIMSLVFVPAAGYNYLANAAALAGSMALWLYGEQQDRSGVAGNIFPVSNVEGTAPAFSTLPISGLYGYSREFVSGLDFVGGQAIFQVPPTAGSWVLEVSYQPEPGVVLSQRDFEQIYAQCNPQVIVGPILVP